jgi:hypothetical protein
MKTSSTRLLTFGLFLLFVATANGQASTPQAALNKFLKLDFDGARLDSDGFKKVFPLTDWKDAPGYDSAIIVRSYKVGAPSIRGGAAKIVVTYDVVGLIAGNTMWEAFKVSSESFKDQVQIPYELVLKNGSWKVHGPNELPHISIEVALKNEEELLADKSRDPDEHKAYQQIVDALRKLSPKQ